MANIKNASGTACLLFFHCLAECESQTSFAVLIYCILFRFGSKSPMICKWATPPITGRWDYVLLSVILKIQTIWNM